MSTEWVLWLFEGIVVAAALMILFARSVFNAGLNLLVVVLSIGVIFGLYGSEFLFISQIMVYGGGILVLILFATMVTARNRSVNTEVTNSFSVPILLAASGVIIIITTYVMAHEDFFNRDKIPFLISPASLGKALIVEYSLPLEVSGILLLVSLIGAALTATQKPTAP